MRVEVIRAFGSYAKGQIIPDMPAGQARMLAARGLVREAEDLEPPAGEYRTRVMTPKAVPHKTRTRRRTR